MADKAAAEARRQKIRNLEFSLFGENNNNGMVGLPDVKAVDEYHERFSNIYKDKHKKEEVVQSGTDLPLFYKEPKKKVKLSSPADDLKSFLGSDESAGATPAPSHYPEENSFIGGGATTTTTNGWLQSGTKQQGRPSTVESLLSEELENLVVEEKNNSIPANSYRQRAALVVPTCREDMKTSDNLIQVEGAKDTMGRATLLGRDSHTASARANDDYKRRSGAKLSKSESLLNMEQDELAMSLSSAKFQLLKNANLERVKAEERMTEEDEGRHFRKLSMIDRKKKSINGNTFKDMPDHVYDDMPSDTFREIPEDVFENIPRAVTARIQNREKRKTVPKDHNDIFESNQDNFTASAPAMPVDDNDNPSDNPIDERDPSSVGFIAMLFTGAPPRPGHMEQVESDFMFALFIQKQEEEAANQDRNPGEKQQQDPSLGHFCAPHLPGFCEANFCIFHTSGPPPS